MDLAGRLVIFDCDGVLVDSERLVQRVDLVMIAALGWPIAVEEIHAQHLGRPSADVAANVERHLGRTLPDGWLDTRQRAYRRLFAEELQPIPGVTDAIGELHEQGARPCVASSGSHDAIRTSLELTNLWDVFDGRVFSAQDVPRGKAAPDLFLYTAESLRHPAAACVVVEDSPAGVAAGKAACMPTIGYAGLTPHQLLADSHTVIDTMGDLVAAIAQLG